MSAEPMAIAALEIPEGNKVRIGGIEYSQEVLRILAPESGDWQGPVWLRRNVELSCIEITTLDPDRKVSL